MRSTVHGMTLRALRTAPLLLLLLSSCGKDGDTPSFIRISAPTATRADGTAAPSSVTDIWVYANDEAIGVWQPGRRIPVLADGLTNIKLVAGVRKNGITNDRIQYPFYATWSQDVELVLGEEVSVAPTFTYYDEPIWEEGFESAGVAFNMDESGSDFVPQTDPADVLVGDQSAAIVLDTAHALFRAVTQQAPSFPNGTDPTFLEIDYRSDTRFLVGVKYIDGSGVTQSVPYVFVSPTGSAGTDLPWRHVYIDLAGAWGTGGTINRQFYIEAQLEGSATSGRITMDNLTMHH